jgi:DNA-directed RNA polymerase subunit RPC12/RpoP
MNRWFCMDCRNAVEIDRHGRCGTCESEAVILAKPKNDLTGSVSVDKMDAPMAQASA